MGGTKRNTPYTTTSDSLPAIFILNKGPTMSCIVIIMYAIVIEPKMYA